MTNQPELWEATVPADLIPAVKVLRKAFEDSHWGHGEISKLFCYAMLHGETADDPAKEFIKWVSYMQMRVGPAAARRFNEMVHQGTLPAVFRGFYDLYVDAMSVEATIIFRELAGIGSINQERLGTAHLDWAMAQVKHLIRSFPHRIEFWVREVCDKQPYNPEEDWEEKIYWRKWQAPMLIIMKPSRNQPYDAAAVWERHDAATSQGILKVFEADFILRLEMAVEKAAGQAVLELAKQPKPAQPVPAEDNPQPDPSSATGGKRRMTTARREVRKLDTEAMYASWRKEFLKLRKSRPDMSDVWCSRQIARMEIARGRSPETIRKHMRK